MTVGKLICVSGKLEGSYIFLRENSDTLIELRFPVYMTLEERVEEAETLTALVADFLELFES